MFKNMKIGIKILLVVLIMALGTSVIVFINAYLSMNNLSDAFQKTNITLGLTASDDSKEALQSQAEEYLIKIAQKQVAYSNENLKEIRRMVTSASEYIEYLYANSDRFEGRDLPLPFETPDRKACSKCMLAPGVEATDEVMREVRLLSNCEAVFAPEMQENPMLDNIYVGTKSGISYRYSRSNLYNESYDPRERAWYQAAMENPNRTVWLDTYTDSYGNTCITSARVFFDKHGLPAGVVASDIKIQRMLDEITRAKIGQTGYAFVIDQNGEVIAHPNFFREGFDKDIYAYMQLDDEQMAEVQKCMQDGSGIVNLTLDGIDSYVTFYEMDETGWLLCISINKEEVIGPALATKETIDQLTDQAQEYTQGILADVMKKFIIFFAICGIIVIMISFAVSGSITRPIQKLARNVKQIGKGEFDKKVEVESADEIGNLAEAFNHMLDDLNTYFEQIKTITAEKERIGAELNVATQIQADMLPSIFPPFPDKTEFDIYATMTPAKEVGGDFYDFFLLDENHLALVMADVSGKGVPAALFMVIAKTLIKNRAQMGGSPAEILGFVNDQLCEGNEADMFVTVWLGILDLTTGKGMAANAGHEKPAIRRAGQNYEFVRTKHSPAVAVMEGMKFREHEFELHPGDSLYIYTDGVAEATNAQNALFGDERMMEALNSNPDASPKELLQNIQQAIDEFVGDAPQFDDITMLCLKYKGTGSEGEI